MPETDGVTMDYAALQEWCKTLTTRLEDAQRLAERYEQAWLLERTRNEVWQLKEDNRLLEAEIHMMRIKREQNHA